jgi:hypothetical protein
MHSKVDLNDGDKQAIKKYTYMKRKQRESSLSFERLCLLCSFMDLVVEGLKIVD